MSLERKVISYQEVYEKLRELSPKLSDYNCIIWISRDWVVPASMLSYILQIPLFIANVNRWTGKVDINWKPFGKILIVDDGCRTWWTINTLRKKYNGDFLALVSDFPEKVDYRLYWGDVYYVFEWQLEEKLKTYEVGYDLDWVICRELNKYEKWLSKFPKLLEWRRNTLKVKFKPPKEAIILTWRPECDKEYTLKWLRKNWIYNRVDFNRAAPWVENSIISKIWWILEFWVKKYYESDEYQAKKISEWAKNCEVLVFNDN